MKIKIPNRKNIWFEKLDNCLYTIHTNESYLLEYARINCTEISIDSEIYDICWNDNKKSLIHSFDPAEGPYIAVGYYEIEGNKVSRIFFRDGQVYFKTDNTKFTVKYMNEEQVMRYLIYEQ